jgi:energy-converting hydrogenase Eha subunit A
MYHRCLVFYLKAAASVFRAHAMGLITRVEKRSRVSYDTGAIWPSSIFNANKALFNRFGRVGLSYISSVYYDVTPNVRYCLEDIRVVLSYKSSIQR